MDVVIRTYRPKVGKSNKHIFKNVRVISYSVDDLKICLEDEKMISVHITDDTEVTFYGKYLNN